VTASQFARLLLAVDAIVQPVMMSVSAYVALPGALTYSGAPPVAGRTCACGAGWPLGTLFRIPGLGWRRCEDRGGKITDKHLDVFMDGEAAALGWGRRELQVMVLVPEVEGGAPPKSRASGNPSNQSG